jgi:hypothetical protein
MMVKKSRRARKTDSCQIYSDIHIDIYLTIISDGLQSLELKSLEKKEIALHAWSTLFSSAFSLFVVSYHQAPYFKD